MISTRIAGTAAVFTFGLAALGGTVMAVASPANAETTSSTVSSSTSAPANATGKHAVVDAHLDPHFGPGHDGNSTPGSTPTSPSTSAGTNGQNTNASPAPEIVIDQAWGHGID